MKIVRPLLAAAVALGLLAACTNSGSSTPSTTTSSVVSSGSSTGTSSGTAGPAPASTAVPSSTGVASTSGAPAPSSGGSSTVAPTGSAVAAEVPQSADLAQAPAAAPTLTDGYYVLQSLLSATTSSCLEGNAVATGAFLSGASFMDTCRVVTGQLWKITATTEKGFYRLQPRSGEKAGTCLDGNGGGASATVGGSAYLAACSGGATQQWRFVAFGAGTYRLQTKAAVPENRCLESNALGAGTVQGGATFLDSCQMVTGQIWQLVAVPAAQAGQAIDSRTVDVTTADAATIAQTGVYYRLQTVAGGTGKCLEGNQLASGAVLGGASFLDSCQDVTGQYWKIVPTENPAYYQLQALSLEARYKCFEGNQPSPDAVLAGAAYLADCARSDTQLWRFVDAGNGRYRLQTRAAVDANRCLEGNTRSDTAVLKGAAFLDTCQNATGQLFVLVPVPSKVVATPTGVA